MNSFIDTYLNWTYLTGISKSIWFQEYLLYFALIVLVAPIVLKIIFIFTKRSAVYKKFDKLWFWLYVSLGLLGVLFWFFINQALPTLGVRLVVFVWLIILVIAAIYLVWHYQKITKPQIVRYHEKKRKEKYLKR